VTIPAQIKTALKQREKVLWSGKPYVQDNLLAYRGWHRVVGIAFIATALAMTAISWSNRAEITGGAAFGVVVLIVTPLVFGFGFWLGLSWLQRDARQKTAYAVTTTRVIVANKHGRHSHTLRSDTDIQHSIGKTGIDKVQFDQPRKVKSETVVSNKDDTRGVTTQAKAFLLSHDDAVAAFAALKTLQGAAT
jgi:hypothetical protein